MLRDCVLGIMMIKADNSSNLMLGYVLTCGVIIKEEKFEHTLTSEKKKERLFKKFDSLLGIPPASKEESERAKNYKVIRKMKWRKAQLERSY